MGGHGEGRQLSGLRPDAVALVFLTSRSLLDGDRLAAVVEAFDSDASVQPTHWSEDGGERRPWRSADLAEHLKRQPAAAINIVRAGAPESTGTLLALAAGIQHLSFRVEGFRFADAAFELGDRLAAATEPELGVVHPLVLIGDEAAMWNSAANIRRPDIQRCGLRPPAARTWFGPHISGLLRSAPELSPTPWGGHRLDLLDDPTVLDLDAATARQTGAIEALGADLFPEWKRPVLRTTPASAWIPIPDQAGPQQEA